MNASKIEEILVEARKHPTSWKKLSQALKNVADKGREAEIISYKNGHILVELYEALINNENSVVSSNLDEILECILTLSKEKEGYKIGIFFLKDVLNMFVDKSLNFSTCLELGQHINMLLSQQPKGDYTLMKLDSLFDNFLEKFGTKFKLAGDYDIQANLTEAALRILAPIERQHFITKHFEDGAIKESFCAIQNQDFENGCRNFINKANDTYTENRSVYSIPCKSFYLGMYKLSAPLDQACKEIWVDFNLGSKSLTAFVNDDAIQEVGEATWETVVIKLEIVKDLRVTDSGDEFILIMRLTTPASELAPFCPSAPEHYAKISFDKNQNIKTAIQHLFGEVRFVHLPRSSPSMSPISVKASAAKIPFKISSEKGDESSELMESSPSIRSLQLPKDDRTADLRPTSQPENTSEKRESSKEQIKPGNAKNAEHGCCPEEKQKGQNNPVVVEEDRKLSDVVPETQDAEENQPAIAVSSAVPPVKVKLKKEVKKTKEPIKSRTMKPRKAKAKAHSPFSFTENDSEAFGQTVEPKIIERDLGSSFTDPRKPKRKRIKQTYAKHRSKCSKKIISGIRRREEIRNPVSSSDSEASFNRVAIPTLSLLNQESHPDERTVSSAKKILCQPDEVDERILAAKCTLADKPRIKDSGAKARIKKPGFKRISTESEEVTNLSNGIAAKDLLPKAREEEAGQTVRKGEFANALKSFASVSKRILDSANAKIAASKARESDDSMAKDEDFECNYSTPKVVKNFRLKCNIGKNQGIQHKQWSDKMKKDSLTKKPEKPTVTKERTKKLEAKRKRFQPEIGESDGSDVNGVDDLSDEGSSSNDEEETSHWKLESTPSTGHALIQSRHNANSFLGSLRDEMKTVFQHPQFERSENITSLLSKRQEQRKRYAQEIDSMLTTEFKLMRKELEKQKKRQDKFLKESIKASRMQLNRLENLENMVSLLSKRMILLEERYHSDNTMVEMDLAEE
ncbi:synaptonemal complex protein 2-like [Rhopilema esculentum]|uniref:synaptonemal complex protein 2-like n=1 Tax=Rhopilema esculentum TaxID=499914 RepID=UPI0031DF5385